MNKEFLAGSKLAGEFCGQLASRKGSALVSPEPERVGRGRR